MTALINVRFPAEAIPRLDAATQAFIAQRAARLGHVHFGRASLVRLLCLQGLEALERELGATPRAEAP